MVARAIDALGRLDFLFNNAGTPATPTPIPFAELDRLTEGFWQAILNTNLIGPFRCAHAAVPALRAAKGAICSTASIAGVQGSGSSIPYAASKAGVINLTRSLARTLAPDIRVNAVAPGFVDSPWNKEWPADRKEESVERTPLKRACSPQDIAETVFFLCAGNAMITGQTIIVDGGLTLERGNRRTLDGRDVERRRMAGARACQHRHEPCLLCRIDNAAHAAGVG